MKKEWLLKILGIITVAMLLIPIAACSSSAPVATPGSTAGSGSGQSVGVTISGFSFNPQSLQVAKGATVTWTNNDSTEHTVTSDDNLFDGGLLASGATFSYTFNQAGTFNYHCKIHPSMTAKVVVQ